MKTYCHDRHDHEIPDSEKITMMKRGVDNLIDDVTGLQALVKILFFLLGILAIAFISTLTLII